jgi:AraC-like DNA-binding protein
MPPAGVDVSEPRRLGGGPDACGHVRIFKNEGCLLSLSPVRSCAARHAASVFFALGDAPFRLRVGSCTVTAAIAVVAPFREHEFDSAGGPAACIDVLPMQSMFHVFAGIGAPGVVAVPCDGHAPILDSLREFHRGAMAGAEAYRLFRRGINLAVSRLPDVPPPDPRAAAALRRLYERPALSLESLAADLQLSPDRLSRLFAREMGFTLRRYVQALKVVAAGRYYGSGKSLTEIAIAAGFSDLAHFSKVWRRSYGVSPAYYFQSGAIRAWPADAEPTVLWEPP